MRRNVAAPTCSVNASSAQDRASAAAKVVYPLSRALAVKCGVCGFEWTSRGKGLFYKCPRCYRSSSEGGDRQERGAKRGQ